MPIPPRLTEHQKSRLGTLEPALRTAVYRADYRRAKEIGAELQAVLAPTGHVARLMHAKNWVFQAAMEAGHLSTAEAGFLGIRKAMSPQTRVYLEATALLSICYLRRRRIDLAEPLMAEALRMEDVIKSERRRGQFRRRLVKRFEEEGLFAATQGEDVTPFDPEQLQADTETAIRTKSEDQLIAEIGQAIPQQAIDLLLRIHEFSMKQLPPSHQRLLPRPQQLVERRELGARILAATRRRVWKSLCSPSSEVKKLWDEGGFTAICNSRVLVAEIAATLTGMRIGMYALAVSTAALVMKQGLDKICRDWVPEGVMLHVTDR